MAEHEKPDHAKELAKHLRLVNFTLVVACVAVLFAITSDDGPELRLAVDDITALIDTMGPSPTDPDVVVESTNEAVWKITSAITTFKVSLPVEDKVIDVYIEVRRRPNAWRPDFPFANEDNKFEFVVPRTVSEFREAWEILRDWRVDVIDTTKLSKNVHVGISLKGRATDIVKRHPISNRSLKESDWLGDGFPPFYDRPLVKDDASGRPVVEMRVVRDDVLWGSTELDGLGYAFALPLPPIKSLSPGFPTVRIPEYPSGANESSEPIEWASAFPELARITEHLEFLPLTDVRERLISELAESSMTIELFGLKIPTSAITSWGLLAVVILQLYFVLHFWRLVGLLDAKASIAAWSVPWVGLYPRVRLPILTVSALILPIWTVVVVLIASFRLQDEHPVTVAVLTGVFVVACICTVIALIRFAKLKGASKSDEPVTATAEGRSGES